jgi:hypothetical protein
MRTSELIDALIEDHAARPKAGSLRRTFFAAMTAGFGVAAATFALTLGVRPDIASAIETWRYDFKFVITITLAVTSARLVWRLARPAADPRPAALAMAAAPLLLLGAVLYELLVTPQAEWLPRALGAHPVPCMMSIALLSLAPLAAAIYALRRSAPLKPGLAGAAAGLLANALATTLYAIHCPDDSPLFGAIWFTLSFGIIALLGMFAGRRVLRW